MMLKKNRNLFIFLFTYFVVLLFLLFVRTSELKLLLCVATTGFTICGYFLLRQESRPSIHHRNVTLIVLMFSLLFVMFYYLSGLIFGFYRSDMIFSLFSLFRVIIPTIFIIIGTELVRTRVLSKNNKFADIFLFIIFILIDILLFANFTSITNFNRFMDLIGIVVIPSITNNVLHHYLGKRYGIIPNIIFRLITILFPYIIPVVPSTPDAFYSFYRLLFPLIVFSFVDILYERKKVIAIEKNTKLKKVGIAALVALMASFVMLTSCQFQVGMIIIGSDSMRGEFNRGDALVFERYEDQIIEEGTIILFKKSDSIIVHRVVDIERINNENRYYTKGDANDDIDKGFILDEHIVGVSLFKIAYIGYPTIWLRDIFS